MTSERGRKSSTPPPRAGVASRAGSVAAGAARTLLGFLRGAGVVLAAGAVWAMSLPLLAALDLRDRLPPSQALLDGRERASITVLDRNGAVLGARGQRFKPLTVEETAPILVDAVLSIEDRRFYYHPGFDPIGLVRALTENYRAGRTVQGGSSLPQQVAKLAFLSSARTVERKIREAPLALAMEWAYDKNEILAIYLNRVYLGSGAFGFEAASQRYFSKSARSLSTAEAALLAGLLRAPSRWSPENDFRGAMHRAAVVLAAMVDAGRITEEERRAATDQLTRMIQPANADLAPHFVDWVVDSVRDQLSRDGLEDRHGDLYVTTTLDARSQIDAAIVVDAALSAMAEPDSDAIEAAMVVLSRDGAVRAMVGGRDYDRSQYNRAVAARRSLGSAFKPFVYAAALEAGVPPNMIENDAPIEVDGWRPRNYRDQYRGLMPLEEALAHSSNAIAVRVFQLAGADRVIDVADRVGFEQSLEPYPSLALGAIGTNPVEVAGAYLTFARRGARLEPYAIEEVRTLSGGVVWRPPPPREDRVISSRVAGQVTTMMSGVVWNGTGRRAQLGDRPVAGKTGTTQAHRDAWFAGFTDQYVGVVWMGRDDNLEIPGLTGGREPAEIWRETMSRLHEGLEPRALATAAIPPPDYRIVTQAAPQFQPRPAVQRRSSPGLLERLFGAPSSARQRREQPAQDGWGWLDNDR